VDDLLRTFGTAPATGRNAKGVPQIAQSRGTASYGFANLIVCNSIAETDVHGLFP